MTFFNRIMATRWWSKYLFMSSITFTGVAINEIRRGLRKNALSDKPLPHNEAVDKVMNDKGGEIIANSLIWPLGLPAYLIEIYYKK